MLLSVLSALARRDVDPWQEAAKLARLPEETATNRLSYLIMPLPGGSSAHGDPATIAARLIALLPRQANAEAAPATPLQGRGMVPNLRALISAIVINAVFMAVLIGTQSIMASHQSPSRAEKAHAPLSSAVSRVIQPPSPN